MAGVTRAVVIGSAGQDGRILTQQLLADGCEVIGVDLAGVSSSAPRAGLPASVALTDRAAVAQLVAAVAPVDALFYLAAFHHAADEGAGADMGALFAQSFAVNVDGWLHVCCAVADLDPRCRTFYAASSHVFGEPDQAVQSERTPFRPNSAYGISKATAIELARFFRARGLHCSTGILYNHESELRQAKFVSQRIVRGAVDAQLAQRAGKAYQLELGALDAVVDWGYACDYTQAMQLIVSQELPDDYVVASGTPHTVADFCALAFDAVGLDWRAFVVERPGRIRRPPVPLIGNAGKLRALGWAPSLTFEQMVRRLVAHAQQS